MKYKVINAGIIGNTLRELRQRFAGGVSMLTAGDTVVILSGINDMLYPEHIISLEEYKENMGGLAEDFRNAGMNVVIATVPQISAEKYFSAYPGTPVADPDTILEAADDTVREIALCSGYRLWDIRRILGNNMQYRLEDGMHLSAAGAETAAEVLAEIIRKKMKDGGTVLCFGDSIFYGPWLKGRGKADPDGETLPSYLARCLNR